MIWLSTRRIKAPLKDRHVGGPSGNAMAGLILPSICIDGLCSSPAIGISPFSPSVCYSSRPLLRHQHKRGCRLALGDSGHNVENLYLLRLVITALLLA